MAHGCIALAMDERHRPIEISAFRWSSSTTAWGGFPVESHQLGPHGRLGEFGTEHALLGLCVRGLGQMQIRSSAGIRRVTSSPGRFSLLCRGYEQKPLAWSGTREMLYVSIGGGQLESLTSPDSDLACLKVEPQYAVTDPHIVGLVLNMRGEILAGCPTGRLYAEALSVALAARLQSRYSRKPVAEDRSKSALSASQVSRVRDYIRENLTSDMGVAELARLVNLSPHYFSMLFKNALGLPPHHYVLQERVREARRLLALNRMSLSELATHLGFADQSHLSRAFRKVTGTTPGRYQRQSEAL